MSYMHSKEDQSTTRYYPKNKDKFKGSYCVCRSSWEYQMCKFLDMNENVLLWSSEPFGIPYPNPVTGKESRYFIDFLAKVKTKKGSTKIYAIEVKPAKETKSPTKSKGKSKKTVLTEAKTWEINKAKWKAAQRYCKLKGWTFKIVTEKELFGKD